MIGLTDQAIETYVPEHLRESAIRLRRFGYEVNYRTQSVNPKKSRKSPREILHAVNADHTQVRMVIFWTHDKGPMVRTEGSVRDSEGSNLKYFEIPTVDGFWFFAASNGRCPCGRKAMCESDARTERERAVRQRVLRNRMPHRQEIRVQQCPVWVSAFHVTTDRAETRV